MDKKDKLKEDQIAKHLAQEDTEFEMRELSDSLRNQSDEKETYLALKNVWDAVSAMAKEGAVSEKKLFEKEKERPKKTLFSGKRVRITGVIALFLLPLLILFLFQQYHSFEQDRERIIQVSVPSGARMVVSLPGGVKAYLNQKSELRFPLVPSLDKSASLIGEGYFEINALKENLFRLQTADGEISTMGAFNIHTNKDGRVRSLVASQGQLVFKRSGETFSKQMVLNVNSRLTYDEAKQTFLLNQVDPYKYGAWREGKMVFRNDRFGDVIAEISKMFNVEIVLADSQLAEHPYRATFKDESLEDILKLLQKTAPIEYKQEYIQEHSTIKNERRRITINRKKKG